MTDRGFPNTVAQLYYPSTVAAAAPDDRVTVSLSDGGEENLYFTGTVFDARPHGEYFDMALTDDYAKLCKTMVCPAYRKEKAAVILKDTLDAAGITAIKITCPEVTVHRFSTVTIPAGECVSLLIDTLKGYGHTSLRYFFDRDNTFRFGTLEDTAKNEGKPYELESGKNVLRSGLSGEASGDKARHSGATKIGDCVMAMDADELKGILQPELTALYTECAAGNGISDEDFAGKLAGIISRIVPYIQDKAEVPPAASWVAGGQYPVEGGPGKVT
jgi:hypothetical protein